MMPISVDERYYGIHGILFLPCRVRYLVRQLLVASGRLVSTHPPTTFIAEHPSTDFSAPVLSQKIATEHSDVILLCTVGGIVGVIVTVRVFGDFCVKP